MTHTRAVRSCRTFTAGLLMVLLLAAAGCGGGSSSSGGDATGSGPDPNAPEKSPAGDIPDNQVYVPYRPAGATYTVKVPEGWSRSAHGGATTFTDKLNSITMQARTASGATSARQARSTEVPKLAHSVKGFHLGSVSVVRRSSGPAVRITYTAAGKASAVTGKAVTDAVERYVFFHHGKALVLTLSGPKGADNVDPWRIVTDSVRWSA